MKRVISLCCVCLILVMSLAVPAWADSPSFIDVLSVSTPNDKGDYSVVFSGSSFSVRFDISSKPVTRYVDLLVNTVSCSLVSASVSGESLTVVPLNSRLYRVFGSISTHSFPLTIDFTTSGSGSLTFLSFKSSVYSTFSFASDAYCRIVASDYDQTIHYVPTDPTNHRIFQAADSFNDAYFMTYIHCDNWKQYDFLNFQLLFDVSLISSISCVMGSINVPIEISYLENNAFSGNQFLVSFSVDLTSLDKSSSDYPMITVVGKLNPGQLNSIDFVNCSGLVLYEFDQNFLLFNDLVAFLSSGFSSISSWISAQTSSLQTEMQDMVISISMEFTNLKSSLASHFSSLDSWIQNQTSSIIVQFNYLKSSLDSWIQNQTTSIIVQFNYLKSSLDSWIQAQTNTLESAIRGDTDPGDDFQDQVDQKDQQMDDMAAVMDSVTKPDIQDINVSVDQYVKPADVQVLATPLTVFLEADLFRTMIIMSILLATVSFTLYGKR